MKQGNPDLADIQTLVKEIRALRRDLQLLLFEKKDLYNLEEIAFLTGYKSKTVRNRLSEGTFPIRARKVGGRLFLGARSTKNIATTVVMKGGDKKPRFQ